MTQTPVGETESRRRLELIADYVAWHETEREKYQLLKSVTNPVVVQLYDANGDTSATVMAREMRYYDAESRLEASGDVKVFTKDDTQLATDALQWREQDHTIRTDRFVRITSPTEDVQGFGLIADEGLETYQLAAFLHALSSKSEGVPTALGPSPGSCAGERRLLCTRPAAHARRIGLAQTQIQCGRKIAVISGESLSGYVEGSTRVQVFRNVTGTQDSTQLYAGWAKRYIETGRLLFIRDVVVIDKGDTLWADTVHYNEPDKIARATGSVRLSDGDIVVHAPEGEYFIDEKRAVFHHGLGACGQRRDGHW